MNVPPPYNAHSWRYIPRQYRLYLHSFMACDNMLKWLPGSPHINYIRRHLPCRFLWGNKVGRVVLIHLGRLVLLLSCLDIDGHWDYFMECVEPNIPASHIGNKQMLSVFSIDIYLFICGSDTIFPMAVSTFPETQTPYTEDILWTKAIQESYIF